MDDSIVIIKGTAEDINSFMKYLNSCHSKIKFKHEIENNNAINLLDITFTKTNEEIKTGIYRKPTQTDLVIPYDSNHPYSYKLAAFRSMVFRLLNYKLDKTEYIKEIATIKQ